MSSKNRDLARELLDDARRQTPDLADRGTEREWATTQTLRSLRQACEQLLLELEELSGAEQVAAAAVLNGTHGHERDVTQS